MYKTNVGKFEYESPHRAMWGDSYSNLPAGYWASTTGMINISTTKSSLSRSSSSVDHHDVNHHQFIIIMFISALSCRLKTEIPCLPALPRLPVMREGGCNHPTQYCAVMKMQKNAIIPPNTAMQCKCKNTVLQSNENVTQMQSSHPILQCNLLKVQNYTVQ